jgi:hypothetical protein
MTTWFEKCGIIFGVIGAIISIPKGIIDGWQAIDQAFFAKPNLVVERSSPLSLTYDPKQKTLTFSCGLVLQNKGTDSEAFESCTAYLGIPGDLDKRVAFSDPDVIFEQGGNSIPKNLPIRKDGDYRSIACETTSSVTDPLRAIFNQPETQREFVIKLSGQDQRIYSVTFDFDLGAGVGATLFDPALKAPKTLTMIDSNL